MKPSHLTTPRNLSECTFEVGYRYKPMDDKPSVAEIVWSGLAGVGVFVTFVALMLAYFDVLVP